MVKEKINWKIYITAGVVTLIIFSLGIGLGYLISNQKYDIIKYDFDSIQLQQKDIEIELLLINSIGNKSCDTLNYEIGKTASQSTELGQTVSLYDNEIIKNPDFASLKKNYIISLIQLWSYWELFKKNCNSSVNTILYFYAIKNCNDCQAQGFVLSYLKEKYPDEIMVFALDKDEDLYSLNLIKNVYNITTAPTLIINNKKYEGLKDINELKNLLVI
jgi:glutaredoxin